MEKLEKGKVPPGELFKSGDNKAKYSKFDDNGVPTHDDKGAEVSKNQLKKLQKEYDEQTKLHKEYLEATSSSSSSSK